MTPPKSKSKSSAKDESELKDTKRAKDAAKPAKAAAAPKTTKASSKADASQSAEASTATKLAAPRGRGKPPVDLAQALVHAFETNERIHQYLLEQLDPSIWALEAPVGKGRMVRGVFAHIHNVRRLWLTRRGEESSAPPKVDRETVTQEEMRTALAHSARSVVALLRDALAAGGHVADFKPDVVGFVAYAIAHEAHHRGQICMLARVLGKPLPQAQGYELWNWRKRADEALEARGVTTDG